MGGMACIMLNTWWARSRRLYLDHVNFCKNKDNKKFKEVLTGQLLTLSIHFQDQCREIQLTAITFRGAHLLDGECKSSDNEGHEVLVFYSTQQLAWKKTALSFLSSPKSMSLFKIEERPPNCGWLIVLEKNFPGFTMGADSKEDALVLHQKPCYFYMWPSHPMSHIQISYTLLYKLGVLVKPFIAVLVLYR